MQTDEKLMVLYQDGDLGAFEELYNRYTSKVYAYLRKRLQRNDAVEDLFQKVFLKVHENRDKYNPELLFAPWLFVITRNILIDWYRRKKDVAVENIEFLLDGQEREVDAGDQDLDIKAMIQKLPENYRQMVELRYLEELDFEDIAKKLNIKESNVRKIVSRGVIKLRGLILGDKNEA